MIQRVLTDLSHHSTLPLIVTTFPSPRCVHSLCITRPNTCFSAVFVEQRHHFMIHLDWRWP